MSSVALMLAALTLAIGWAASSAGCVETAECDQTIPCNDTSKICFDYVCQPSCQRNDECDEGLACISCDARDVCFGMKGRACVDPADYDY